MITSYNLWYIARAWTICRWFTVSMYMIMCHDGESIISDNCKILIIRTSFFLVDWVGRRASNNLHKRWCKKCEVVSEPPMNQALTCYKVFYCWI